MVASLAVISIFLGRAQALGPVVMPMELTP